VAAILDTTYFGAGATAMVLENGETRIYYQGVNGAIYCAGGVGSAGAGAKYGPGVVVVPAERVRVNTPLAVVSFNEGIIQVHHSPLAATLDD
jgi:hypothetical protein